MCTAQDTLSTYRASNRVDRGYTGVMCVLRITAERGDKIQVGTVKGVPVSRGVPAANADHPVVPPYPAFIIAFLFTMAVGFFRFARAFGDTGVKVVGYNRTTMFAAGDVFVLVLASFFLAHLLSVLRGEADRS